MLVQEASVIDTKQLLDIYQYYILNTAITFEEEVPSYEEFSNRIATISSKYPYLIIKDNSKILGYAYANTFKERKAYRFCAELSIYIDKNHTHQHLGKLLYEELEKRVIQMNITNMYACVSYPSIPNKYLDNNSIEFHEHLGFKKVADLKNCGYKFNTWHNMAYLEKIIGPHTDKQKEVIYYK